MFKFKKEDSNIEELDKGIRKAFKSVRDEMDDHLASINENTEELQEQSAHIDDMELKFEKLQEKVDEIHMMLSRMTKQGEVSLSDTEKNVFMVLYSIEQTPLSYTDISIRTGLTELAVKAHIFSMINKGIPILERQIDGQSFFRLDKKFKEIQAKENVLKIDMDNF
jgi:biotin operon repressor